MGEAHTHLQLQACTDSQPLCSSSSRPTQSSAGPDSPHPRSRQQLPVVQSLHQQPIRAYSSPLLRQQHAPLIRPRQPEIAGAVSLALVPHCFFMLYYFLLNVGPDKDVIILHFLNHQDISWPAITPSSFLFLCSVWAVSASGWCFSSFSADIMLHKQWVSAVLCCKAGGQGLEFLRCQ